MNATIEFQPFVDHGTGFTSDQQRAWLRSAKRAVNNAIALAKGRATVREIGETALAVEREQGSHEELREIVAGALGSTAAYVTVR